MRHTFGIEIEAYNIDRYDIATALRAEGLGSWQVKPDGSLNTLRLPFEVVSPILTGEQGITEIEQVFAILNRLGAKTSKECGLHVHLGCAHYSVKQIGRIAKMFTKYERAFDSIVAPSRRGTANRYCRSILNLYGGATVEAQKLAIEKVSAARTMEQIHKAVSGCWGSCTSSHYSSCRYFKMNLHSFLRRGTIEYRQHQGTLEAEKAVNWLRLLDSFTAHAADAKVVKVYDLEHTESRLLYELCNSKSDCKALYPYFKARREELAAAEQARLARSAARIGAAVPPRRRAR